MKLEDKLKFLFLKAVLEDMDEDRGDSVHVTEIVYDCLRKPYYDRLLKEKLASIDDDISPKGLSEDTILTFWIGKKLHEMPISNFTVGDVLAHELPVGLEDYDVVGSIDEIVELEGNIIIVDKKTTRRPVSSPYSHHIKQVEMYSVLLNETYGIRANMGAIIYIDVSNKKVQVYTFRLGHNYDSVLREIKTKAMALKRAIEKKELPPANVSWLCNYCAWFERCIRDGW